MVFANRQPYTRYSHAASFDSKETYDGDNLELTFKTREAAEAFRAKVLNDELGLSDLDLDLSDKPKEKAKSTMPAHLFALLGQGSNKTYQFSRKTDEVWDYSDNNIFKVGKIVEAEGELQMLNKDEDFFVYKLKPLQTSNYYRIYNGDTATVFSLMDNVICKSIGNGKCDVVY